MSLDKKIKRFNNIFGEIILKEGWYIGILDHGYDQFYHAYNISDENDIDPIYIASKYYGFKFNDCDDIVDFDINKVKRHRHLITGSELGLL